MNNNNGCLMYLVYVFQIIAGIILGIVAIGIFYLLFRGLG
jgi:hypothetical protein